MEKQNSNTGAMYLGRFFLFIGLVFMVVSFIIRWSDKKFMENAEQTTAMITRIEARVVRKRHNGNVKSEIVHDVYVSYEVDDRWYEEKLDCYDSTMHEGKEVEIYYHKDRPNKIRTDRGLAISWIFFGDGLLVAVVGTFLCFFKRKKKG